jgi:ABC-2 type transport system permease protein
MTWKTIAHRDRKLTVSARSVKTLLALLVFAVLLAGYLYPVVGAKPITTARFSGFVINPITTILPFIGVLLGYNAVVSERETGSILLSLSLPQSRKDVVFGKYTSRTGVLAVTIAFTMVGAGFLVVYPFGELDLLPFLAFTVVTIIFGAIWSGIGIAISLAVATKRRAVSLGFGLVVLFAIVWDMISAALEIGLNAAGIIDGQLPGSVRFLFALEPGHSYERVTTGFIDPSTTIDGPWYLNEWVALLLLIFWAVGPVGLTYLRFAGRDVA